ncbi:hypothetical protein SCOR_13240 [Sulfidibacter corallicola]
MPVGGAACSTNRSNSTQEKTAAKEQSPSPCRRAFAEMRCPLFPLGCEFMMTAAITPLSAYEECETMHFEGGPSTKEGASLLGFCLLRCRWASIGGAGCSTYRHGFSLGSREQRGWVLRRGRFGKESASLLGILINRKVESLRLVEQAAPPTGTWPLSAFGDCETTHFDESGRFGNGRFGERSGAAPVPRRRRSMSRSARSRRHLEVSPHRIADRRGARGGA